MPGHDLSLLEVAVELLLQNAVDELDLLLLAQLHAVLGFLTATLGLALGGFVAAVTQHDGIQAQLAAALKNRSSVDCHSNIDPFSYTRRRLHGRQPLCGMGVQS